MLTASRRIDKCPTPGQRFSDKFPTTGTDEVTDVRRVPGGMGTLGAIILIYFFITLHNFHNFT